MVSLVSAKRLQMELASPGRLRGKRRRGEHGRGRDERGRGGEGGTPAERGGEVFVDERERETLMATITDQGPPFLSPSFRLSLFQLHRDQNTKEKNATHLSADKGP